MTATSMLSLEPSPERRSHWCVAKPSMSRYPRPRKLSSKGRSLPTTWSPRDPSANSRAMLYGWPDDERRVHREMHHPQKTSHLADVHRGGTERERSHAQNRFRVDPL